MIAKKEMNKQDKRQEKKQETRKFKILEIAVDEYIRTGEPVASKLLAAMLEERCAERVSSATVRNILSELEEDGYLEQPHTSAGRIPTITAYRRYIAQAQQDNTQGFGAADGYNAFEDVRQFDELFDGLTGETAETILETAAKALADVTQCAVAATINAAKFSVITKVEAIPAGKRIYALLIITSGGEVKNKVCRFSFDLTEEQLKFFADFVRENLEGHVLSDISDEYIENLAISLGSYMISLSPLLKAVSDLSREMMKDKVIFEGEGNLIGNDLIPKNEIVKFIDERDTLAELLSSAFSGLTVSFGDNTFTTENAGLISGGVKKDGRLVGGLGIIGPLRLDYKRIIPYFEYFTSRISGLLSDDTDE